MQPMDCSMPGFPVLHHLLEFAQTHVSWVGDAIQPSHLLSSPSPPAFNLSQRQSFLVSQFFALDGQSIRTSASASVLNCKKMWLLNTHDLIEDCLVSGTEYMHLWKSQVKWGNGITNLKESKGFIMMNISMQFASKAWGQKLLFQGNEAPISSES